MLAEPMERLVSRLMDAAVWLAAGTFCSGAAAMVSQVFFGGLKTDEYGYAVVSVNPALAWTAFAAMLAALFLYEVPSTARSGAHYTKRRWDLTVVGPDGRPPGYLRATVRWATLWLPITGSVGFFGMNFGSDLGFLALGAEAAALGLPALAFVREDKRSFADLVAGTRVLAAR